ncbi:tRNA preQ1(34) S-adenosylmethionine ribosyltransferase-isomerase QueA [candidate division FCPU426 bacterium]|nr:tRNA preQ1(34) S-adenosylmethionine ribosyltransferase-isomerase QueA [candidate division FCPU426 bacterium]
MKMDDFDFHLPPGYIAQTALPRGASRLMVWQGEKDPVQHDCFRNIEQWLQPKDCLVVNNSRVIPARLFGYKKHTHARIELLLHREIEPGRWEALARPAKRLQPGVMLIIGGEEILVEKVGERGGIMMRFASAKAGWRIIWRFGITPLPPYIHRNFRQPTPQESIDRRRYQTVFASHDGSVAAPTAGLHFSRILLQRLKKKGIRVVPVTLHVGWGTFAPVTPEAWSNHKLHAERYVIPAGTVKAVQECRRKGGRVIACGTTTARALEAASHPREGLTAGPGVTELFIRPGYCWKQVDGLLTNFHLPRSSLFMLVCAFAGTANIKHAYHEAVKHGYRFYSYGDAMLCVPSSQETFNNKRHIDETNAGT